METVLETCQLTKVYGSGKRKSTALEAVSIRIAQGEFLSVMGPSGCGKTTLLFCMGLLSKPTSGDVLIKGRATGALPDHARTKTRRETMGFVFQRFNLLAPLTVFDNIAITYKLRGHPYTNQDIIELLDAVNMRQKRDAKPMELSMGQQQRVAIARALAHNPEILLADEPTGNLDSHNAQTVLDIFKRLNEERGQTTLLITHSKDAAGYAHRILAMKDGRIVR